MNDQEKKKFKNALLFAAAVILIYVVITNLSAIGTKIISFFGLFSSLIIGILVALILYKPMKGINSFFLLIKRKSKAKHKLPDRAISKISLVLTLILTLLLIYFVGNSVVPQIVVSFKSIFTSIETYYPTALAYLEELGFETSEIRILLEKIDISEIVQKLTDNANKIFATAFSAVNSIATLVTTIVSAAIFSIYLLSNLETLKRQSVKLLRAYFKPKTAEKIKYVGLLIINTFSKFFTGQCLEAVILGIIFFIAMNIFRFPYAVVISVIIGVTAIIPYVGAFLGCAVGAFLIFMQSPMEALLFIGMFLIIQQLENNLIYPRVVGNSVNLPAIWTFTALIVGGALFGVTGMLFFIPLTSVLYSLLKSDVNARIKAKYGEESTASQEQKPTELLSEPQAKAETAEAAPVAEESDREEKPEEPTLASDPEDNVSAEVHKEENDPQTAPADTIENNHDEIPQEELH